MSPYLKKDLIISAIAVLIVWVFVQLAFQPKRCTDSTEVTERACK